MSKSKFIFNVIIVFLLSFVLFKVAVNATKYKSVDTDGLIIDGSFLNSTEGQHWETCTIYYDLEKDESGNASGVKGVTLNCEMRGFVLLKLHIKKIYRLEFKSFGKHKDWTWVVDGYSLGDLKGIKRVFIDVEKWSEILPNGGFSVVSVTKQKSW